MKSPKTKTIEAASDLVHAINRLIVIHPRMMEVVRQIDNCRMLSKSAYEPECLLVLGESGVGKTTIKDYYIRNNPRKETPTGTVIPVLAATIPVPATMKAMATALLISLGDPYALRGSLDNKTQRLYKLIRECRVELIFLDEFQHFIDRDNLRVLRSVSDWLKNLISETRVPVVLTGLPNSRNVLEANEQLMRRFSSQRMLEPFYAGAGLIELQGFLAHASEGLPFQDKSVFDAPDMAIRFFSASQGYVSKVMKVMRGAAFLAAQENATGITRADLERAYQERILRPEGCLDKEMPAINPFAADWVPATAQPKVTAPAPAKKGSGAGALSNAEVARRVRKVVQ